jgi:hypothetical protein
VYSAIKIKFKLTANKVNSMQTSIIKKLFLFQTIPTNPKINKRKEKLKQTIKGIKPVFKIPIKKKFII